ncbi:anchored repeat-type ABC transporter permease subunit [Boudabousia liubingyangii]|uniref:Anchored repeat-type ABC transporter permease subunit n=1 Tax=Boudabousia liubingyangii TaxID=1921764 RepID=A0A1Q5PK78_9ACTO|nr:anchored repeat-type ABC transporter permease subunit [Boudabousia liubingyangii]OKL46618.1 anchored repeat-type ABC transporter permease subunit [Boudabousia liubingyangii]OKL46793.1 anchored repeat-type ABC transporter permease subunit [Boudabousia liubingyangii]
MLSPYDFIQDLFNPILSFLPRALIVAILAAIICGVIGTHVVLRGMAFIGDAVAHSVFPGLAVAFVLQGSLIVGGLVAGTITAILVAFFSQNRRIKEDTVIGIFFAAAFALGLVVMSLAPGYSGSLQSFLFGSITGVSRSDIVTVSVAGVLVIALTLLFNKELVAVSLDREMARVLRLPVLALDILLYFMVTIAVVMSIHTIGNILVLALLVTPAATARLLTDRLGVMMTMAAGIGALSALLGVYLSWSLNIPTGATIVLVATVIFLFAWIFAPKHGLLGKGQAA